MVLQVLWPTFASLLAPRQNKIHGHKNGVRKMLSKVHFKNLNYPINSP